MVDRDETVERAGFVVACAKVVHDLSFDMRKHVKEACQVERGE